MHWQHCTLGSKQASKRPFAGINRLGKGLRMVLNIANPLGILQLHIPHRSDCSKKMPSFFISIFFVNGLEIEWLFHCAFCIPNCVLLYVLAKWHPSGAFPSLFGGRRYKKHMPKTHLITYVKNMCQICRMDGNLLAGTSVGRTDTFKPS